jgi:hypothetical protein
MESNFPWLGKIKDKVEDKGRGKSRSKTEAGETGWGECRERVGGSEV